jgi:hypothetical protein
VMPEGLKDATFWPTAALEGLPAKVPGGERGRTGAVVSLCGSSRRTTCSLVILSMLGRPRLRRNLLTGVDRRGPSLTLSVVLKGPVLRTGTGPGPDRFVTGF